jgi:hypothetical protein
MKKVQMSSFSRKPPVFMTIFSDGTPFSCNNACPGQAQIEDLS